MKTPKVSIVIISYDPTARFLKKTFEVLTQQTFKDFEVILVDSGKQKVSSEVLANSSLIKLVPTKTIFIPSVVKKDFNYATAYNQGIQKAQGEIIIRLSADAIPVNNLWLQNLTSLFQNPKVGIVFGKFVKVFIGDAIAPEIKTKFNLYSIYEQIMWTLTQPNSPRTYQNFPFVAGACFAFRKEIWEKHPLNEDWRWGDEYEFTLFALQQGYVTYYTPLAQIYHTHNLDFWEGLKRIFKDFLLVLKVLRLMLRPKN